MTEFRLRMLGGLYLENHGGPLGLVAGQPKRLALLALLARSGTQGVSRDRLLALLWPEDNSARARNSLNQSIHNLRRDLSAGSIVAKGSSVALDPGIVSSDVSEFELAVAAADYATAVALYQGPFLDGLFLKEAKEFEEWVSRERKDLEGRHRDALTRLIEAARVASDRWAAIRWSERLVATDPHSARAARLLITVLTEAGDRPGAVQAGRDYCERVARDLGLQPDATILAMTEEAQAMGTADALARQAAPAPAAAPYPNAAGSPESPELRPGGRRALTPTRVLLTSFLVVGLALGVVLVSRLAGRTELLASRVLVMLPPEAPADSTRSLAARRIADWLLLGMAGTGKIETMVEVRPADGGLPTAALARRGRSLGAATVVALETVRDADSIIVTATVVGSQRNSVLGGFQATAGVGDLGKPAELMRQGVLSLLALRTNPELTIWADSSSRPTSWESYQLFADGRDAYLLFNDRKAVALLKEATTKDSAFVLPLVWLMFVHAQNSEWWEIDTLAKRLEPRRGRLPPLDATLVEIILQTENNNWAAAFQLAKRLGRMTPQSEWGYWVAQVAANAGYPREGLRYLEGLPAGASWRSRLGGRPYWGWRMAMRRWGEDYQGMLDDLGLMRTEIPASSPSHPTDRARALAGLGRDQEALALIDSVANGHLPSGNAADILARFAAGEHPATGRMDFYRRALAIAKTSTAVPVDRNRDTKYRLMYEAAAAYRLQDWPVARALYDSLVPLTDSSLHYHDASTIGAVQARRGATAAHMGDSTTARAILAWFERIADSLSAAPYDSSKWHPTEIRAFRLYGVRIALALGERITAMRIFDETLGSGWYRDSKSDPDLWPYRDDPDFARWLRPKG